MTTTRHNFTTVDQVIFLETEPTQSALSLSVLLQTKTCALFLLFGEGQLKKRSPPAVEHKRGFYEREAVGVGLTSSDNL